MARNLKILLIAVFAILIIGGVYAFAAANVVPDSAAGYKANVVPGYTVSDIVYDLDDANPTLIDAITFNISPTSGSVVAATVKIQTAGAGAWTNCSLAAGTPPAMAVTCTFGSLEVVNVTALNIVATSSADPTP